MSEWPMRGHFRYLRFKTFPMTPRIPQCKVFWALLSSSKHSRIPEGSKPPTFSSVGLHPHTWPKWGCDIPPWMAYYHPWRPPILPYLKSKKNLISNPSLNFTSNLQKILSLYGGIFTSSHALYHPLHPLWLFFIQVMVFCETMFLKLKLRSSQHIPWNYLWHINNIWTLCEENP
jgi:hypothetical protein